MYVFMYVCLYYTYMYVVTYAYIDLYLLMNIHIFIYVCMKACIYYVCFLYVCTHMYVHTHVYACSGRTELNSGTNGWTYGRADNAIYRVASRQEKILTLDHHVTQQAKKPDSGTEKFQMSGLPTLCDAISRYRKTIVQSMSYAKKLLLICKFSFM